MQQWLSLFLQCAVPVVKTLTTVKTSEALNHIPTSLADNLLQTQQMLAFLGVVDEAAENDESTLSSLDILDVANPQAAALTAFSQTLRWAMQQKQVEFQRWRWQQEKVLQQTLSTQQRGLLLQLARQQRQTTLQLPEVHKILEHWPLRLFPSQLLETHNGSGPTPLRILIAPPKIQFEREATQAMPDLELSLAQRLRDFLDQFYGLHNPIRPTEFLGGAWESKRFHGEASIKTLFNFLKSEPTLILESEIDGEMLNFRIAYWGPGQHRYSYRSLFRLPYRELLQASAQDRARHWQTIRANLMTLGRSHEEIARLGGENEANLSLLEEMETLEAAGIDVRKLRFDYHIANQDWNELLQFLATCHCLVSGWMADLHHLVYHEAPPTLPDQLPELSQAIQNPAWGKTALEATVSLYQTVFSQLGAELPAWSPELFLKLAQSLLRLPDPFLARTQIQHSLQAWLAHRQLPSTSPTEAWEAMLSALVPADRPYLEALADCFAALEDARAVAQVNSLLAAIATLESGPRLPQITPYQSRRLAAGNVLAVGLQRQHCQILTSQGTPHIQAWKLLQKANDHPQAADTSLPRLLRGHQGTVQTLAISADGQILVSSDRTKDRSHIKVWDLATGQLQQSLGGHRQTIHALTLSTAGHILASGSHKIKLWNLQKGESFCTLFGHRQWVYALAMTSTAETVISGSRDTTVKVWDVRTNKLIMTLTGHQASVRSLAISKDSQWLVSGSDDHTLRLWELSTGKLRHTFKAHQGAVHAVAFSSDGQQVISGGADTTLKIWDLQTGALLQTLTGHSAAVRALDLCPDGKTLASASDDGQLNFWQIS
jgi:hypothetical protein